MTFPLVMASLWSISVVLAIVILCVKADTDACVKADTDACVKADTDACVKADTDACVKADTDACVKDSPCSCKFQDGSILSLKALAKPDGKAAFVVNDTSTGIFSFLYNPCLTFTEGNCLGGSVAVCQDVADGPRSTRYTCGVQSSARFVYREGGTDSDVFLLYDDGDLGRKSYVKLTCINDTQSQFTYVGEDPAITYNFELASSCACLDNKACQKEPDVTCDKVDECSCSMSDGSGIVDLHALNNPNNPLKYEVDTLGWDFYYNPCKGFTLPDESSINQCINVSVCQTITINSTVSKIVDIGDPASANFGKDENGINLNYVGPGGRSVVRLMCDRAAREKPVFGFVGEILAKNTFYFDLRSVCACPGGCITPPRICTPIDSCSCSYEDGSGTINLHSLDNRFAPLTTNTVTEFGDVYTYFYNPCSGVILDQLCFNVSACQKVKSPVAPDQEYRLGTVSPQSFSNDDDGNLVISYGGGDVDRQGMNRQFHVTFVCDPDARSPIFGNATEAPIANYNFVLRSACTCPNGCDDLKININ